MGRYPSLVVVRRKVVTHVFGHRLVFDNAAHVLLEIFDVLLGRKVGLDAVLQVLQRFRARRAEQLACCLPKPLVRKLANTLRDRHVGLPAHRRVLLTTALASGRLIRRLPDALVICKRNTEGRGRLCSSRGRWAGGSAGLACGS